MTSGLRRAHKYIWLLLTITIPVFLFFSIKNLDFSSSNSTVSIHHKEVKQARIKFAENDLIKLSLYKNSVEVILKSTLKNSSSTVYTTDSNGNKKRVIGQITASGIYTFHIKKLPKGLLLYDAIKDKTITKLLF